MQSKTIAFSSAPSWLGKLAFAVAFVAAILFLQPAQAQTFTVLYSFTGGSQGADPHAAVTLDGAGNLYGTTYRGGAYAGGTIYKLDAIGNEMVLHSFGSGADAANPNGSLLRDGAGNLYGTSRFGGTAGKGAVFKLDSSGHESVLYSFSGGQDGSGPQTGLLQDQNGNLYGATPTGGPSKRGVVFKVDPNGVETVVYGFAGGDDGANPLASLVHDKNGNLYGTTLNGGSFNSGTVYKLTPGSGGSWTESVLYSFTGGLDGHQPYGGVVLDPAGNFYGMTGFGGDHDVGVIFKLDSGGNETVLHSFSGEAALRGGPDGAYPFQGLLRDNAGNLYGMTGAGGAAGNNGVAFRLDPSGKMTLLHTFTGQLDGASPFAELVQDATGTLYGVTLTGGKGANCILICGGVLFKITP